VDVLKKYPKMELELESHTDCRNTKAYNLNLSQNRFKSTKAYLAKRVKNGEKRLTGKGYGESRLVTNCPCEPTNESNCTDEQHQKNRRTMFIIKKL
jgi:outer membrane protein OmpA-like peptidoglycan-associated protein